MRKEINPFERPYGKEIQAKLERVKDKCLQPQYDKVVELIKVLLHSNTGSGFYAIQANQKLKKILDAPDEELIHTIHLVNPEAPVNYPQ